MANHKSALKRIRSNNKKRLRNRFQHKTARNAVRKLRETTDKNDALKQIPGWVVDCTTRGPRAGVAGCCCAHR